MSVNSLVYFGARIVYGSNKYLFILTPAKADLMLSEYSADPKAEITKSHFFFKVCSSSTIHSPVCSSCSLRARIKWEILLVTKSKIILNCESTRTQNSHLRYNCRCLFFVNLELCATRSEYNDTGIFGGSFSNARCIYLRYM